MLALYIQLYQNIEIRVNDMANMGRLDAKEALDALVSYGIAEEGTNTLYIKLVETMLKREEPYNIVEIEMILNYFPHSFWRDEPSL